MKILLVPGDQSSPYPPTTERNENIVDESKPFALKSRLPFDDFATDDSCLFPIVIEGGGDPVNSLERFVEGLNPFHG